MSNLVKCTGFARSCVVYIPFPEPERQSNQQQNITVKSHGVNSSLPFLSLLTTTTTSALAPRAIACNCFDDGERQSLCQCTCPINQLEWERVSNHENL